MNNQLVNHRYQILKKLGNGGFGTTYLAEDTQMPSGRHCVIKELKPLQNNPKFHQSIQERFQKEAIILENLGEKHEQIPQLYAYCEEQGQFYLVQEYIKGETLGEKIANHGILDETTVQEILLKLLTVLCYIHRKKIIHRDIKPDNIILRSSDNLPVLIDFGAVKETMRTTLSLSGNMSQSIVIGTPGFMSPEQSMGRPVYASDIYGLGLTMIYLLTGKTPPELTPDHITGEIQWQHYTSGVSSRLATVLDKAIKFHYQDRFPTAQAMIDALVSSPSKSTKSSISTMVVNAPSSTINSPQDWSKMVFASGLTGLILVSGFFYIQQQNQKKFEERLSQIQSSSSSPTAEDNQNSVSPSSPLPSPIPETPRQTSFSQPTPRVFTPKVISPETPQPEPIPSAKVISPETPQSSPIAAPGIIPAETPQNSQPAPVPSPTPSPSLVKSEPTQSVSLNEAQAISTIKNLYNLVSNQQYDQAVKVFSPQLAQQFDPRFFKQFERVTVEDLKVISKTDSSIKFIGQNTYFYPDGSTQREHRSYTIKNIEGENKIAASEFIKVTKFR